MNIQLTPAQEERLRQLAAQSGVTPQQLLGDGIDRFLDRQEELHSAVRMSDREIAAGRVLDQENVVARMEKLTRSGEHKILQFRPPTSDGESV